MVRRRSRRSSHRFGILLLLFAGVLVLGGEEVAMIMIMMGFGTMLLVVGGLAFGALRARRSIARHLGLVRSPAPLPAPRLADWDTARRRFDALRTEYAAHECDALAVLRLPALTDVTEPATARFVDAFAETQALDTEHRPPPTHAAAYTAAVDRACRAWQAARDAAERIRLAGLSPAERSSVQRVIKLLTVAADSGHDGERLAAYGKARDELARLERAGTITMPRPAQIALDEAARGRLPA